MSGAHADSRAPAAANRGGREPSRSPVQSFGLRFQRWNLESGPRAPHAWPASRSAQQRGWKSAPAASSRPPGILRGSPAAQMICNRRALTRVGRGGSVSWSRSPSLSLLNLHRAPCRRLMPSFSKLRGLAGSPKFPLQVCRALGDPAAGTVPPGRVRARRAQSPVGAATARSTGHGGGLTSRKPPVIVKSSKRWPDDDVESRLPDRVDPGKESIGRHLASGS